LLARGMARGMARIHGADYLVRFRKVSSKLLIHKGERAPDRSMYHAVYHEK